MNINLLENGKVILSDEQGIQNVLPIAFFHQHPRIKEAILITSSAAPEEIEGISVSNILVDKKPLTAQEFLKHVALHKGSSNSGNTNSPENIYKQYATIKNYEALISFMKNLNNHSKKEVKEGNKTLSIDYGYATEGLTLNVKLTFKYRKDNPDSIDYVTMNRSHIVRSNISNGVSVVNFDKVIKKYSYSPVISHSYITLADLGTLYRNEFNSITTYEDMFSFITEHKSNVGGEKHQNGKLVEKEYYCQFYGFSIRVTLRYYYKVSQPNRISHILMFGNTSNISKPSKVYRYDTAGNIIGYYYAEAKHTPFEENDPLNA